MDYRHPQWSRPRPRGSRAAISTTQKRETQLEVFHTSEGGLRFHRSEVGLSL